MQTIRANSLAHFPPLHTAWAAQHPHPGLLAVGGDLSPERLIAAYRLGVFPWFAQNEPLLWWCPNPRMVLQVAAFRLHRSLRQSLKRHHAQNTLEIRFDHHFESVIQACAHTPRKTQQGTWIHDSMIEAYSRLHHLGHAHSVETWIDGELVGGLYCVNIGRAVFGESMFSLRPDASKMALAALVHFCQQHQIDWIDCQQQTAHLQHMGAGPLSGEVFATLVQNAVNQARPVWRFDNAKWQATLRN